MEYQNVKLIHIDWVGPHLLGNLTDLMNRKLTMESIKYMESIPFTEVMYCLYRQSRFSNNRKKNLSRELVEYERRQYAMIYAGRLAGEQTPSEGDWSVEIDLAEKLLIYVHKPAYNSKNLSNLPDSDLQDVHILNWGSYRDLLPELSGLRWTSKVNRMAHRVYSLNDSGGVNQL